MKKSYKELVVSTSKEDNGGTKHTKAPRIAKEQEEKIYEKTRVYTY